MDFINIQIFHSNEFSSSPEKVDLSPTTPSSPDLKLEGSLPASSPISNINRVAESKDIKLKSSSDEDMHFIKLMDYPSIM
jgi:hypothetical protein